MSAVALDQQRVEAFLERFVADCAAAAHAATVALGDRLGLYRALVAAPQTANELAARSGCHPRLVQEWLNAQVASDYCAYDPVEARYWLTPEQAACLADENSPAYVVANMAFVNAMHKDEEGVRAAFAGDQGLGWHEHDAELFSAMARASAVDYAPLVSEWIPALDGVADKLAAGARVADVGCGQGGPLIALAQSFPASTFCGFDYHAESISAARGAAARAGVSDRATFEVAFADAYPDHGYDLICTFDALHDMGDPVAVARHIRRSLGDDGVWMIVEFDAADDVTGNVNPIGRLLYAASTFVCVPNGVSQGGTRVLGAAAGEASLRQVAAEAGFTRVRRVARTDLNVVYEARH